MITQAFVLLAGHALTDFALQSDAMARGKNRNRPVDPSMIPPGQTPQMVWPYWLTAHALISGFPVALLFDVRYGIAEAVAHWIIDFGKCDNRYGIHVDQALHITCKAAWLAIWWNTFQVTS